MAGCGNRDVILSFRVWAEAGGCEARTNGLDHSSVMSILRLELAKSHPLRAIRALVNEALTALAGDFSALYSPIGRLSIPPEKLLRAMRPRSWTTNLVNDSGA
jgi:hypothetical protein